MATTLDTWEYEMEFNSAPKGAKEKTPKTKRTPLHILVIGPLGWFGDSLKALRKKACGRKRGGGKSGAPLPLVLSAWPAFFRAL